MTHPSVAIPVEPRPFSLTIEQPLLLPKRDETALLRQALTAKPQSVVLRAKLARLLFVADRFDEAIDVLEALASEAPDPMNMNLLAEALLSRERAEDDARAVEVATAASVLAREPRQRSAVLASLGKALRRLGRVAEARGVLVEALEADAHNANAYKRLASIDLDAGATATVLDVADALIARGAVHARILTARALALASLGRVNEARDAIGLDSFFYRRTLAPPPGHASIEAFNADLQAELLRHPDLRFNRYGTASAHSWRVDQPATAAAPMVPALQRLIRDAVLDYVASLTAHDAPWLRARPAAAQLHNWCVMTDAQGYEEWHVHQQGWLSGVYYVDVPPTVMDGTVESGDRGGCIAFGMPEDIVGGDRAAEYGEQLVRPYPGLLMLFPSHTYHRTFAHGSDHRRICLAFDIQPR